MYPNGTAVPGADAPGGRGAAGLYGLFWQLRGGECSVKTGFGVADASGGGGGASNSGALHGSSGMGLPIGMGEASPSDSAILGSAGVPAAGWEGQSVGCNLALHGNASQVPVWLSVLKLAHHCTLENTWSSSHPAYVPSLLPQHMRRSWCKETV